MEMGVSSYFRCFDVIRLVCFLAFDWHQNNAMLVLETWHVYRQFRSKIRTAGTSNKSRNQFEFEFEFEFK
jgi:hypothetical protein